ncbi:MarR family winged helix-turn-helix transcriptional regulator, partial [Bacteroidota bacterium]
MIDIIDILGVSALPSRMKRISNKILIDADKLYEAYGFDFKASWYPIYRLVLSEKKMSITEIAQTLQVKHPSIVYLIKQMLAAGIISQSQGKKDKRYHLIHITKKGENLSNELQEFWDDH